jgi:hypothetical protein
MNFYYWGKFVLAVPGKCESMTYSYPEKAKHLFQ